MSGAHVAKELNRCFYDVKQFLITKGGQWMHYDDESSGRTEEHGSTASPVITKEVLDALLESHILFPVLHGPYGEDGTIQGFFEMFGKAYAGCDHRSSAVCMDKILTKQICEYHGIKTAPYKAFSQKEWQRQRHGVVNEITSSLSFPLFVKGAHLGSSIGVYKVETSEALEGAIDKVCRIDSKFLVEKELHGRELECVVIGDSKALVFPPGEIVTNGSFYDYEAKYGAGGFKTIPKATGLSEECLGEIKTKVYSCYRALGCQGLARIDFFLDADGAFWLNEVNPLPGFTPISLYPKVCEANGLKISDALDKIITIGLARHRQQQKQNKMMEKRVY